MCIFHLQLICPQTCQGLIRTSLASTFVPHLQNQSHGLCVPDGPTRIPAAAGASGLHGEESLRRELEGHEVGTGWHEESGTEWGKHMSPRHWHEQMSWRLPMPSGAVGEGHGGQEPAGPHYLPDTLPSAFSLSSNI